MKNVLLGLLVAAFAVANTGCSYMSLKKTQNDINGGRVMASGNKAAITSMQMGAEPGNAIRAIRLDDGGVVVAADLLSADVLSTNTLRHAAAAAVDGVLMYFGVQAIQQATQSGNDNVSSSRSSVYNIDTRNSDRTTITINENETTTTTTTSTRSESTAGDGNSR